MLGKDSFEFILVRHTNIEAIIEGYLAYIYRRMSLRLSVWEDSSIDRYNRGYDDGGYD